MNIEFQPAIVVVGFNRPDSMKRVLGSVRAAHVPAETTLIISIDGGGGERSDKVRAIADQFEWPGPKSVLARQQNMGLKRHILSCGDLSREFGSVILLEDDIFAGPDFYHFATQALTFYDDDERIAGIGLYRPRHVRMIKIPFQPLDDGFDNFFMQIPISWGQAWTSRGWTLFREWYSENEDHDFATGLLPPDVLRWPSKSSWKKYFFQYMLENEKYFAMPHTCHSTCFQDAGVHAANNNATYQMPLAYGNQAKYRFSTLDESESVYDCYFSLLPKHLKQLCPALEPYDFETDLYGIKPLDSISTPFVLTCRNASSFELGFSVDMKPLEANLIHNQSGGELKLAKVEDIIEQNRRYRNLWRHAYPEIDRLSAWWLYWDLAKQTISRRFRSNT